MTQVVLEDEDTIAPVDASALVPINDAVNAWFLAYINGKTQRKHIRIVHELARTIPAVSDPEGDSDDLGTFGDMSPAAWASYLAQEALKCKALGTDEGMHLIVSMIQSNRARVYFEQPNALCENCGIRTWQGGGPMCECNK